ncbi:MAG TPA: cytochrome b [Lamprocystis sp. (in: g-proteobacteria)]|nr:cytochrome b [Lamprocystis sp. (in: g-proteobacteria)]
MIATDRYALVQRLLHWLIVMLVLGVLGVGITLGFLGYDGVKETFGGEATNALFAYHKTGGVLILALMILRLALRVSLGAPPYRRPLAGFERIASRAVHGLFYVGLLAMPVIGWLATAAGGYPVEFFGWTLPGFIGKDQSLSETLFTVHGVVGWVILGLIVLHVAGAVRHWLIKRDGVMARMSLFG